MLSHNLLFSESQTTSLCPTIPLQLYSLLKTCMSEFRSLRAHTGTYVKVRGQPWASISSTSFWARSLMFSCCMFYVKWLMSFWSLSCLHHLASHGSFRITDVSYCARVSAGRGNLNSGPPTFMASTLPTCIILLTRASFFVKSPP